MNRQLIETDAFAIGELVDPFPLLVELYLETPCHAPLRPRAALRIAAARV